MTSDKPKTKNHEELKQKYYDYNSCEKIRKENPPMVGTMY